MSKRKKIILILSFLFLSFSSFGLGFLYGRGEINFYLPSNKDIAPAIINKEPLKKEIDFSLFWNVWDLIKEKYAGKIDYQKMFYGAISGMVNSLEDPYTAFLDPEQTKKFEDDMKGTFEGIGAEIGIKNNQLMIIAPLDDTPAQKAGLLAGDKILKINNEETQGMSLNEAVSKIRGPKGTEVKLLIMRDKFNQPKEFKITRAVIEVKDVVWSLKENDIAYIKIRNFGENSANNFKDLANEILSKNPKGIILDLRDNPGGYLDSSVEIASKFIPSGVILYEKFKDGHKKSYNSSGDSILANYKLVVLINQGSASASEIVAGAIRDHHRGTLVGEKTFGKGSVQNYEHLKDGSSVRITVAYWLTPSGESINEQGIKPDIEVKMTDEDYNQNRDPQLKKAIEIIKGN